MKLIVWLGNPWREYAKTRHNVWFIIVDDFLKDGKWIMDNGQWKNEWQDIIINDQRIILLKPLDFMNRSWSSVSMVANFYKIAPKDILVIHDDIDLPVGKIQLKLWWSSAGHNWLKSIIEKLWTKDFWRLRIGIDRPANKDQVADYVLHPFKKEEKNLIYDKTDEIKKYIWEFLEK